MKSFSILVTAVVFAVFAVGCGQTTNRPPPPDAGVWIPPTTPPTHPPATACTEGDTRPCYGGPAATKNIGNCQDGEQTCVGGVWSACEGEVGPAEETCATPADDDCDGQVNEEGEGCDCQPGSTRACYSGPAGTQDVGVCHAGTQTCNASGSGYGPCTGEQTPVAETCNTTVDDDCDGLVNEGGTGCVCAPGASESCYDGPQSTLNVGICESGTRQCNAQGTGWGSCTGQVLPKLETCTTAVDDNCNGAVNEGGPGCVCAPGQVRSCYSGPSGTANVGICQSGTETCNPMGTGWSACSGEVTPAVEDCNTAADENCDGMTPPCQPSIVPIIDLRADTNRNGTVDLSDASEDLNEHVWSGTSGAIFLANIDDDLNACPKTSTTTDSQLAACHDGADTVINGASDLTDLARLRTVPWPTAPSDASATITVSSPGVNYVRLFKRVGTTTTWSQFLPSTGTISASELQAGVEFGIEGRDILRDSAVWDGRVTVTLNVDSGTGPGGPLQDGSDSVQLRQAPVIFRHHLDPVTRVYAATMNSTGSLPFRNDLSAANTAAMVPNPVQLFSVNDQWTQDYLETAYMAMPATGGQFKVIHVNFRSPNYGSNNVLRSAGRVVYTVLRGPDVAGATSYSTSHNNGMDTLNSFGNHETIPPYTAPNGTTWTVGKVLRGSTPTYYPDPTFEKMITAQAVQGIFHIDTEWLLVGHVDETLSFVKTSTPRGWTMLFADTVLGRHELQQAQMQGYGGTSMFVGKYWSNGAPAQVSISAVLSDPDVMNESAWAATKIDEQVLALRNETGLTTQELVKVTSLFQPASGYSLAFEPGMVNGISLSDTVFGAPKPHGPVINGVDIFRQQFQSALQPHGITIEWIENWDLYHRLSGEVHCGSNTTRVIPTNVKWWESGL